MNQEIKIKLENLFGLKRDELHVLQFNKEYTATCFENTYKIS